MSEGSEKESRTEQATDQRYRESIDKGEAPVSREAAAAVSLFATWAVLVTLVGDASLRIAGEMALVLQNVGNIQVSNQDDVRALLWGLGRAVAADIAPALGVLTVVGIASTLAQSQKLLALDRLSIKASRISPLSGFRRIFGKGNILEFAKTCVKLSIVPPIAAFVIWRQWTDILDHLAMDVAAIGSGFLTGASMIFSLSSLAMIAIGGFDLVLGRLRWQRGLRMTKQEVRYETKQNDGDPALVARRRAIAAGRIKRQLKKAVPRATLVVTNPTHFAVALRYVHSEGGAPMVVAKGKNHIALNIRRIADEHDIPIMENKALARSLYDRVEVERRIPPEFYRAVADIMILLQRRGQRKQF